MNFDEFTPSLLKKRMRERCSSDGACCKRDRHLYTTTALSCCIPASYQHLSATLHTISITVVTLQDNRAVFRIFIALLRFSFDSPSCFFMYLLLLLLLLLRVSYADVSLYLLSIVLFRLAVSPEDGRSSVVLYLTSEKQKATDWQRCRHYSQISLLDPVFPVFPVSVPR